MTEPTMTRLDEITYILLAEDTRKALKLAGFEPNGAGRYIRGDLDITLIDAMEAFRANPELGTARMESIRARALIRYEAEA